MEKNGKDAGTTPEKGEEILSGRMLLHADAQKAEKSHDARTDAGATFLTCWS